MTTRKSPKGLAARGAGLAVVALSLGACQPPSPPLGVIDLAVEDNVFFALVDLGTGVEVNRSEDGGRTWSLMAESGSGGRADIWPSIDGESTACIAGDHCFRTEASPTPVWESLQGAEESPAWSFPTGRHEFLERFELDGEYGAYRADPRDIVTDGEVILVAMRNDGVLRRGSDGVWTRGVLGDPKPFAMWGHNIDREIQFAFYVVVIVAVWAAVSMARRIQRWSARSGGDAVAFGPWLVLGWLSLGLASVVSFAAFSWFGPEAWGWTVAAFTPGTIALMLTWDNITPFLRSSPKGSLRMLRLGPLGLGLACYLVFLAWSGGVIAHHAIAVLLVFVLIGAGLVQLTRARARAKMAAPTESRPSKPVPAAAAPEAPDIPPPPREGSLREVATISAATGAICVGFWALFSFAPRPDRFLVIAIGAAVLVIAGALLIVARRSGRPSPASYATAGAVASLVGGPAVGTMFALRPGSPRSTAPRIGVYVIYIVAASLVISVAGEAGFVGALILSPFTVLLGDHWAARPRRVGLFGEFPK